LQHAGEKCAHQSDPSEHRREAGDYDEEIQHAHNRLPDLNAALSVGGDNDEPHRPVPERDFSTVDNSAMCHQGMTITQHHINPAIRPAPADPAHTQSCTPSPTPKNLTDKAARVVIVSALAIDHHAATSSPAASTTLATSTPAIQPAANDNGISSSATTTAATSTGT
jgi:hypothetical protein